MPDRDVFCQVSLGLSVLRVSGGGTVQDGLAGASSQQPGWGLGWVASVPDVPLGGLWQDIRLQNLDASPAKGRRTFLPPGRTGAQKINQAESWKKLYFLLAWAGSPTLSPALAIWAVNRFCAAQVLWGPSPPPRISVFIYFIDVLFGWASLF